MLNIPCIGKNQRRKRREAPKIKITRIKVHRRPRRWARLAGAIGPCRIHSGNHQARDKNNRDKSNYFRLHIIVKKIIYSPQVYRPVAKKAKKDYQLHPTETLETVGVLVPDGVRKILYRK